MKAALANFQTLPLKDAARQFLAKLGYRSEKFLVGAGSKPQDFLADFASGHPFDEGKALVAEWKSADLLFQLTDQELSLESALFTDDSVQRGLLKSYIFIAIELKGGDYARGKFSGIARQINRLFPMPVMVIFKHGDRLSIAVINRRRNKTDDSKDVLEKATLIRDINFAQPHRGHLDILASLALPNLVHPQKKPITDFDTLHAAWEQIFNVELLNERFYRELANWYFWALPQVEFPADLEADDEKRRATGLIRLLTRLIFCWFLKEKGLIPEKLFHPADLAKLLKGFDPESETSSTYYQAILQNLFFATLNQRMGKDGNGKPYRVFATDEGFQKNRATHDINNLFRYESLFAVPQEEALALFADIPFLNGGLFECLDRAEESDTDIPVCDSSGKTDKSARSTFKKRYLDGFSRNAKKRPHLPDRLFFDSGETADLSEVYGDKKRKSERVTGLITILSRYKFTIVENTPIDQEIALDPELLGKVFENLLASYNEETKTTARKQTGSFYTPRPIVDYMVDESLKAHLARALENVEKNVEKNVKQTFLSASPSASPPQSASSLEISKTHRDLPHWKKAGAIYWITFRMADSLPQEKLRAWKEERDIWRKHHPEPWDEAAWKEYNERFGEKLEAWLDAGMGSRALARLDVREAVKSCLLRFDGERLLVHAAVIMPNHVHALIEPLGGHDLSKLLQGVKGASAREANKILGATGSAFWLDESYDHIVRSEAQYQHFVRYIAENPVKPGLKASEFWLKDNVPQTFLSASSCPKDKVPQTFLSASSCPKDKVPQTFLSASSTQDRQTEMSAPLSDRLDLLFAYTEKQHPFTPAEVATLITAIDAVKILDPACGSGAFPMGVLHKLVYILGKLDPDNERWKQTQLAKLDSAPMREELERAFADNNDDYGRKLYLIENCLYGVDIQPIAIQITKLRFFISLVCDQKTNRNKKDNLGIRPLPNLETKFVAANSLIGLPIPEPDLFIKSLIEPVEKEIEAAYHGHFTIQRRDQKLALQKKIKTLRQKLTDTLLDGLGANKGSEVAKKAQHLADWDPFDPQSSADFFDPHWMFGRSLKHGFDVVIGNPPYVRIQMLAQADPKQPARLKERYASASKGNYDLYVVFVERGLQLLQPHGQLSYILPHKFFNAQYGEPLRKLLADAKNLRQVVHFGDEQIFPGATNYVCLLFLDKGGAEQCRWIPVDDLPAWLSDGAANETAIASNRFTTAEWNFTAGKGASLFERLQRMPVKLGEIAEMFVGLQTSADTVFLFKAGIRIQGALAQVWSKELNREVEVERALLKPVIRSGRIGRYWATQTAWVLFPYKRDERKLRLLSDAEMQNQFPCAWKYLSSNKRLLEEREHGKFSKEWWQLYPKNLDLWEEPKIMLPYMISELAAFYDEGANYFVNVTTGGFGLRLCNSELDVKYVTGLLNSHLLDWFLKKVSTTFHGGYFAANKQFLVQLPIRRITFSSKSERAQHDAIVSLVEGILAAKQANPAADTSALEREIDQQVYALYGLTPEEIAIVEGTAP